MSRLHRRHLALDGTSDQSEVADDIQKLVTSRLIVEIKLHIVEDTTLSHSDFRFLEESCDMVKFLGGNIAIDEHDGVGQVATLDEVAADERLQLMQENEGSARRNLLLEIRQVLQRCMLLVKHFGIVFHLHVNLEMVARFQIQFDA